MLTLDRLYNLPIGSKMIAYVGNFPYDLARCDRLSPADAGAPKYKQLLLHLEDSLRQMERNGAIKIIKSEIRRQRTSSKGTAEDWREFSYEVERLK